MLHLFQFILYALYFGVFIFIISRWKFFDIDQLSRSKLIAFFVFKAWAGLVITLVYTYYYTDPSKADIHRYFRDSKIISSVIFSSPIAWFKILTSFNSHNREILDYISNTLHYSHPENDFVTSNSFFIRLVSLLNYFSLYNIYVDTLLLDFIGFIGLSALFKSLQSYFKHTEWALFIPVYLLPSVVFWSSGLLKESLLIPALGAYIYTALKLTGKMRIQLILTLVALLFAIAFIKIYVALFLLACSPMLLLAKANKIHIKLASWCLFGFYGIMFITCFYFWGGEICSKIIDKRNEFIRLTISENAGSALDNKLISTDCNTVLSLVPSATIDAIMRPFLWDKWNLFSLLFAAENFVLLTCILILMIFFLKKPDATRLWLSVFCLAFALLNYELIGLTVPVMGAIVHYRIVATPFLLLGVLFLTDMDKLHRVLTKFKLQAS